MGAGIDKSRFPDLKIVPTPLRVSAVVDFILSMAARYALDGGVLRPVIILNSLGMAPKFFCIRLMIG